jgi:hypothetical protein
MKNNKKIISISVIVVIMIAIAGVFYMKNKTSKQEAVAPNTITATATVREATFGSAVNVTLSETGKKKYIGAVKYQVYYEGKLITSKEAIGIATTAFPARKQNDKITIKLFKADNKEAYSVDLKLQKEDVAK